MWLQETTRFRLATGQRKKYSQTIHVNTVGAHYCRLLDDPLLSTPQACLNTGRSCKASVWTPPVVHTLGAGSIECALANMCNLPSVIVGWFRACAGSKGQCADQGGFRGGGATHSAA